MYHSKSAIGPAPQAIIEQRGGTGCGLLVGKGIARGLQGVYQVLSRILEFVGERERERATRGDRVLFSSVGLWEGFLGVSNYTDPLPKNLLALTSVGIPEMCPLVWTC